MAITPIHNLPAIDKFIDNIESFDKVTLILEELYLQIHRHPDIQNKTIARIAQDTYKSIEVLSSIVNQMHREKTQFNQNNQNNQ